MDWKDIVKLSTLLKVIYRFNAIPVKIPMEFFIEIKKNNLNHRKHRRPEIAKTNLSKNKSGGITFPNFFSTGSGLLLLEHSKMLSELLLVKKNC